MKTTLLCGALAIATLAGCVVAPPPPVAVVREPAPVVYQPGYTVDVLPAGYRTVRYNRSVYYVDRDTYYRPSGRRYVVVARPY